MAGQEAVGRLNAHALSLLLHDDRITSRGSRICSVLRYTVPDHSQVTDSKRRDVRVVEGARLESVCRGNSTVGSNPTLSANFSNRSLRSRLRLAGRVR